MRESLCDVVAVDLKKHTVRIFARSKPAEEAKAIIKIAVMRRGCDTEFYALTEPDKYDEGDQWRGK